MVSVPKVPEAEPNKYSSLKGTLDRFKVCDFSGEYFTTPWQSGVLHSVDTTH